MTKQEGLARMDSVTQSLSECYEALESLYESASHPIAEDVQLKVDDIIRSSIGLACMGLNFKELAPESKKPFAALLYAAADALSGEAYS